MSDSNTLTSLRQSAQNNLARAQKTHANLTYLLDALPDGTPVPTALNDFGYCAEGSMRFEGGSQALFERLLELYPPQPLVKLYGSEQTIKPAAFIRENEKRWAVLDIYPVVQAAESHGSRRAARWWTMVGGKSVEMKVEHAGAIHVMPKDEERKFDSQGEFCTRKPVEPTVRACALTVWTEAWSTFCDAQGYRANQRPFLMALLQRVRTAPDLPWTDADLPEPNYALKPGTAVAVVGGTSVTAALLAMESMKHRQLARGDHAFDRIGDFRALFTPQQVEQLLEFVEERRLTLPAALEATQAEFDTVEQAYRKFFETRGAPCDWQSNVTLRRLLSLIQQETGLRFKQQWVQPPSSIYARQEVSIRICFDDRDQFRDFKAACVPGQRLLPQDVPVRFVD